MALSPNYGFPEPDNASLVKNGAQDIRALGDSIDSFLFRPFGLNPTLNSAMQIWQRGTSITQTAAGGRKYCADRWELLSPTSGAALTVSRQVTNDTTNLPFIQYCLRFQRDSGSSATAQVFLAQSFESINAIPYAGKTVTFSFYARAGANFSATSSLLASRIDVGTGTDQNLLNGYTGSSTVLSNGKTLTTTWQRFTTTGTIPTTATEFGLLFAYTPTGTAGAADYFEVTGVQLEVGSVATPFKTYATIQGELAACQRYYFRFGGDAAYQRFGVGSFSSTTVASVFVNHPVPMRVSPTSLDYSTVATFDAVTVTAITTLAISSAAKNATVLDATVASGGVQYRPMQLTTNNSTSGFVGLNAEL
jgi:hypothetical protein